MCEYGRSATLYTYQLLADSIMDGGGGGTICTVYLGCREVNLCNTLLKYLYILLTFVRTWRVKATDC